MTQFKPRLKPLLTQLVAVLLGMLLSTPHATNCLIAQDELLWIEGEQATESRVIPHPWYDQVQKDRISDGKLLSHFDNTQSGQATYVLTIPADGRYEFWVRGNPVQSRMEYRLTPVRGPQSISLPALIASTSRLTRSRTFASWPGPKFRT